MYLKVVEKYPILHRKYKKMENVKLYCNVSCDWYGATGRITQVVVNVFAIDAL